MSKRWTSLTKSEKFKLFQIIHVLPKQWCEIVATYDGNLSNVFLMDHNLILKNQVYTLSSKLDSKELYKIQILLKYTKPTSQHYFEKHFSQSNIGWKKFYILPRVVTVDDRMPVFQYKLLNKILVKFVIVSWCFCSSCNSEEETPFHIFHACAHVQIFGINFRHTLARILSFHV